MKLLEAFTPKLVTLSECEFRLIHEHIKEMEVKDLYFTASLIAAQVPMGSCCKCERHRILLTTKQLKGIKMMLNDHCLKLAEMYFFFQKNGISRAAVAAEIRYEEWTELMLRIKI